ncbi:MAG TPA: hypothetical protein VMT15_20005 [Bryobacteraceae bacterium]|nr:hypothetical protein [Bryobacteraceae bacterium]
MLFFNSALAIYIVVVELVLGALVGTAAAAIAYRSRLNRALFVRAGLFGSLVFFIVTMVSGWAGAHAAFSNGKRMDVAPWGENLWLRNRLADYEGMIAFTGSALAGVLAGVRFKIKTEKV